eukprot:CAMPEP_0168618884 /NCGR_PEP_ID=MMETSP0449_2-20121227/6308_1 /TAXON_ID=1082188 /ORGANISM="Strombidium rassoulzadegani, Strain ras09" /LENGTH=77 /DNA_ID=CAMNT_0008659785 /DNA_START=550 /DNA_END=779 /DNA_ORIENTATION=+
MMIDVHCYPMVERIVMLENTPWNAGFEKMQVKEKAPHVYAYVHRMKEHPKFKPHAIRPEAYSKLMEKFEKMEMGEKA